MCIERKTATMLVASVAAVLILVPTFAFAIEDTWGTFTASRLFQGASGIYWNHGTNENGDLIVDAAVIDSNGNVIETARFDQHGDLEIGSTANGTESLQDYITRTEGTNSTSLSGTYDWDDLTCNMACDDPYSPNNELGGA